MVHERDMRFAISDPLILHALPLLDDIDGREPMPACSSSILISVSVEPLHIRGGPFHPRASRWGSNSRRTFE
jgi:hypothetical protein